MNKPITPTYEVICVKTGKVIATVRTSSPERAIAAAKGALNFRGEAKAVLCD